MNIYLNYEEAHRRLEEADLFVVRALSAIHRSMLNNANSRLVPSCPFDVQYYYDSLVRTLAIAYKHPLQQQALPEASVSAINIPQLDCVSWRNSSFVRNGMAENFIGLVKCESREGGRAFDLSFACAIASDALDDNALALFATE